MRASSFHLSRLRAALRPFRLHWFPRLRSTNDHAAEMRRRGELFAPAVVLTGRQTAGRGRGLHSWWSGAGCLTVTFVFPIEEALAPWQVPLAAGLAVRNAAAELTGHAGIELKWPNDVLLDGRKIAGLLCERVQKADLIGLGLNVNLDPARAPPPLQKTVDSLSRIARRPLDITDALVAVAGSLARTMRRRNEEPFQNLLREYDQHHALVGRRVKVVDSGQGAVISGRCEGLDETGRLILRGRNAVHRVVAGQVQTY